MPPYVSEADTRWGKKEEFAGITWSSSVAVWKSNATAPQRNFMFFGRVTQVCARFGRFPYAPRPQNATATVGQNGLTIETSGTAT
jgi:hypothetical protein